MPADKLTYIVALLAITTNLNFAWVVYNYQTNNIISAYTWISLGTLLVVDVLLFFTAEEQMYYRCQIYTCLLLIVYTTTLVYSIYCPAYDYIWALSTTIGLASLIAAFVVKTYKLHKKSGGVR